MAGFVDVFRKLWGWLSPPAAAALPVVADEIDFPFTQSDSLAFARTQSDELDFPFTQADAVDFPGA